MATAATRLRLNNIKLVGFKSFVDPTTVPFPSDLVAIVGPNGCGKSNIIDAVRWVMGESSAKNLRGESMADVIFNGSADRKPLGQASIELTFDNPNGAIGGQYAEYSQISIKRQVTRDGQSSYYLNGVKCRRRDITDIFLGTGLGPRSYAIIGQGTISRIIEAKPEELRVYLEEAAGISKYKERRRETENRIRHTRDNLDRLNDLREELEKQLNRLNRQAKAAERYKELKVEERQYKAQLLALRWQTINEQLGQYEGIISEYELQLEAARTEQTSADANIEKFREALHDDQEAFNGVQEQFYSIGAEVARLEQSLQHHRERQQQLQTDLAQSETALQEAEHHWQQDSERLTVVKAELAEIEPEYEMIAKADEASQEQLFDAEQVMQDWQARWDSFSENAALAQQQAEVEQTRIQHFEQTIQSIRQRVAKQQDEKERMANNRYPAEIETLQGQSETLAGEQTELEAQVQSALERINEQRQANKSITRQLDESRGELQRLKGRQASLEALQQAALGQQNDNVSGWLEQHHLSDNARLAQGLDVTEGWEKAVEVVLGENLQAVCVDGFDPLTGIIEQLDKGSITFIDTSRQQQSSSVNAELLSSKVSSNVELSSLLGGVYIADSLTQALSLRDNLSAHESVVTRDGLWLSQTWLRVAKDVDKDAGVIARERELKQLADTIDEQSQLVKDYDSQLDSGREALQSLEAEREELQKTAATISNQLGDVKADLRVKQSRFEQVQQRVNQIEQEIADQQATSEEASTELASARQIWQQAMETLENNVEMREALELERDEYREALDHAKHRARDDRNKAQELSVRLQVLRTELDTKQQHQERMQQQMTQLRERKAYLDQSLEGSDEPIIEFQQQLETALEQRLVAEESLTSAKEKLSTTESQLRQQEELRHLAEKRAEEIRTTLDAKRMEWQEQKVRRNTIQEQLQEAEENLDEILQAMPEEANVTEWETTLEQISTRIQRLGPINLAAIEEFTTESERKNYLDAQHEDLIEALTTLENAIHKIDKETRARFKDTYDKVNNSFKTLFPKIFGGGSASLDMTGEDLLDTGIAVMARPPGKRNSTIHLLSGGEKALTAIALVFAIFQLTPAPFCMLDEVDAPLDDANVMRYCNLVKEMSADVQFIFISHNKVAIEMADHLAGVTMKEPGVSRMVSVDIDEAMALAED
ncbi:MAG: chromosome segregation protein SMC [Legionellales bacterium]|nr:chromosome segregation protein SMC [Legionellales bacterium]|tara:strand:- start:14725 stop:18252 length:3528 start_codon:yes stop_codon:yes gene_type:complete